MRLLSKIIVLFAGVLALVGCGQDPMPPANAGAQPVEHGVFISATDCAETGKLTVDQCGQAIDQAVAEHQVQAPSFAFVQQCEGAYGVERCDRGVDGRFRPRLQAFFVTLASPAHAVPLYPPSKSLIGFQSPSHQTINARDETLKVSVAALTLAHENAKLPTAQADNSDALGTAASDIH